MRGILHPNIAILVISNLRLQRTPRLISLKIRQMRLEDLQHVYHFFDMFGLKLHNRFWWLSRFCFLLGECYCCLNCCTMLVLAVFGHGMCFNYHCGFRARSTPSSPLRSGSQRISLPERLP